MVIFSGQSKKLPKLFPEAQIYAPLSSRLGGAPLAVMRSSLLGHIFTQRREQAVYFVGGVVMDEADAQDAAVLLDAEALGEIQRVEISVPGENAALAEKRCNFRGVVAAQPERQRRAALIKLFLVGNAEDAYPRNCLQLRDQSGEQFGFVSVRGAVGRLQRFAAVLHAGVTMPADGCNVIHGGANPGD